MEACFWIDENAEDVNQDSSLITAYCNSQIKESGYSIYVLTLYVLLTKQFYALNYF